MPRDKEVDHLFKLVIIGRSSVGKSSLMMRFADDDFSDTYVNTIGVDFKFNTMNIDDKRVKFQIWDTAGQERFRTITNAYYKNAHAIVVVYDTTSQASYEEIEDFWLTEVRNYGDPGVELLLLGNKADLPDQREVEYGTANDFAEKNGMMFFETSAKEGVNVSGAFVTMARKLIEKRKNRKGRNRNKDLGTSQLDMDSSYTNDGELDDGPQREEEGMNLEVAWKKTKDKTNELVNDCC